MWKGAATLALLALLSACGDSTPQSAPEPRRPDPVPADPASPKPREKPTFDWTGEWAVRPGLCDEGWWRFDGAKRTIVTAGHLACDYRVESQGVDGSFQISADCSAEGDSFSERWAVRRGVDGTLQIRRTPASGQAMAVTLRKCPLKVEERTP